MALWFDIKRDFLVLDGWQLGLHTQPLGLGSTVEPEAGDEELFRKRIPPGGPPGPT